MNRLCGYALSPTVESTMVDGMNGSIAADRGRTLSADQLGASTHRVSGTESNYALGVMAQVVQRQLPINPLQRSGAPAKRRSPGITNPFSRITVAVRVIWHLACSELRRIRQK